MPGRNRVAGVGKRGLVDERPRHAVDVQIDRPFLLARMDQANVLGEENARRLGLGGDVGVQRAAADAQQAGNALHGQDELGGNGGAGDRLGRLDLHRPAVVPPAARIVGRLGHLDVFCRREHLHAH